MTDVGAKLSVWKLDDGEKHWVVARSESDAKRLLLEDMVACGSEGCEVVTCQVMSDDAPLGVTEDDGTKVTKPCGEWVAGNGRGYLCGSCW